MKIIPANLSSKLKPNMRHGFTTLTQSQKCRANNDNILAHPLLRNLKGIIQQGRSRGDHDWLSWVRSQDKRCILCRQIEVATTVNRKTEARKTDLQCSALAGQPPCPHVTSCLDCCHWMWILAWEFVTRSCLKPQNPCSHYEIHLLFEHGFYLKKPKLGPDLHAWCDTGKRCGRDWSFRQCFRSWKRCTRIYDVVAT